MTWQEPATAHDAEECLHTALRDLVALSNMPAWWVGQSPSGIADSLCEILLHAVRADVVHVQVTDPSTGESCAADMYLDEPNGTVVRGQAGVVPSAQGRSTASGMRWARLRIGARGELGHFAVGSTSPEFPEAHETVLMQVASNQLAVALRYASLMAEHQRALARVAEARTEAERASSAKSDFLGIMSHELRTPLTAISAFTELIVRGVDGPITSRQRADLARIRRAVQYLVRLIDSVLSFLSVSGGHVSYDIENVAVDEVVEAACELITPSVETKGLTLDTSHAVRGLRVRADRSKLQQIILNLLSNAIKYTDEGGVRLFTVGSDVDVTICVQDSGPGIAPDEQQSVFEPFVRTGASARKHEGTGLGLAISRDFAAGMHGALTVTSELGRGSTFSLRLPRSL